MRLILLGPPGAGKSTQARDIQTKLGIPHIAVSDMLRTLKNADTPQSLHLKKLMESGNLAPDKTAIELISSRLNQSDCKESFTLDAFPRNLIQAEALKGMSIKIDYVILLDVDDSEIIKRLSGRRIHLNSGRTYHLIYNPPKNVDKDDLTDEPLIQRDDDQEEIVKKRLAVYYSQTECLIEYYSNLATKSNFQSLIFTRINGVGKIEEVHQKIFQILR